VLEAGRWADRLSVNVEMPRQADLDTLAPEKSLVQITRAMNVIRRGIDDARDGDAPNVVSFPVDHAATAQRARPHNRFAPAGQTTQMIIGATDATDAEVLFAAAALYSRQKLRRIYYSAFIPVDDAAAEAPPPIARERRLYQADWLIREFGFSVGDLTPPGAENLDLGTDPKLAWALRHPERFPVDVNRAPKSELLRVPGLGLRSVETILTARRRSRVTLSDLAAMRVPLARSLPFILTADHIPRARASSVIAVPGFRRKTKQLELFPEVTDRPA
jgi:predicted DNA-binding helix-hairpin-helix protein